MEKMLKFVVGPAVVIALLIALAANSGYAVAINIVSDSTWKSYGSAQPGWETLGFDDSGWRKAYAPYPEYPGMPPTAWIPGTQAVFMWDWPYDGSPTGWNGPETSLFRKTFSLTGYSIDSAQATVNADDNFVFYVNGTAVSSGHLWGGPYTVDILPFLTAGENVFAIDAREYGGWEWALFDALINVTPIPQPIPEPSSLALLALGLAGTRLLTGRRKIVR